MFRRSLIDRAIFCALMLPGAALAEVEVSGYIKNETAVFAKSGQVTGDADTQLDDSGHDGGDLMKFENSGRMFVNGDIGEESSWHADVNIIYDSEGANQDYRGHKIYTQNDWLRELYVDTALADWDFRLGKQQVVWGTADGIKLLDIINPTDYRELVQNTTEDSRIPIWMLKAERDVGDNGNIQLIVSQVEENKIPGLNKDGDSGQPFIMKGVDTITGGVNGFLNIAPNLGKVSNSFHNFSSFGSFTGGAPNAAGLAPFSGLSVDGFAAQNWNVAFAGMLPTLSPTGTPAPSTGSAGNPLLGGPGTYSGNELLNTFTNDDPSVGPNSNGYVTNLTNVNGEKGVASTVTWNPRNPQSAFEYMPNATFATFNTFGGNIGTGGAGTPNSISTRYERDYPDDSNVNIGGRYKAFTQGGLNISFNYFYHYSANPSVELDWYEAGTNKKLTAQRAPAADEVNNATFAPGPDGIPDFADTTTSLSTSQVPNTFGSVSMLLHDGAPTPTYYGAVNPNPFDGVALSSNSVELRFTEKLHRVHSIGSAFDYALDVGNLPIVLRGEFLYDKDDKQPVIDKRLLAIGDLTNSLTMEDADYFKYVIGVDVTVLKNLLVSGQFIQFRNLDFENKKRTCTTQFGSSFDCSKYTGDFTTLHLNNGLQKGYKNKEFYSLFLSKPFGPSDEHRWNNIVMYEEGGGYWNRLDMEYSFTDNLIGTAEWNQYWGDEDTQFGQFKDSSNVQVGLRYLFD